jgi:hypothetical protein
MSTSADWPPFSGCRRHFAEEDSGEDGIESRDRSFPEALLMRCPYRRFARSRDARKKMLDRFLVHPPAKARFHIRNPD